MKMAEITPIFKKNDNLRKENYRSVNLLTIFSKLYERILSDQMTTYFNVVLTLIKFVAVSIPGGLQLVYKLL